jgi:hypothetical protein
MSENVSLIFVSLHDLCLRPLDQGPVAALKAYYLRHTFSKLIGVTDAKDKRGVEEFWKSLSMKHCIDITVESWGDVTPSCVASASASCSQRFQVL